MVQFRSRGSGYALFLTPGEVVLNLERQQPAGALRMSLTGANATANAVGLVRQPMVSYFIGNDPKNWYSGIPTYGKVNYSQIYPGVDLSSRANPFAAPRHVALLGVLLSGRWQKSPLSATGRSALKASSRFRISKAMSLALRAAP